MTLTHSKTIRLPLFQARLYRPVHIPEEFVSEFRNYEPELKWETAKQIFEAQSYEDPPMRGRQSLNPLRKLGFVKLVGSHKVVQLTASGKRVLQDKDAFQEIFFRAMLKLQFPNLLSKDFSEGEGFNIRPFTAVLRLIKEVGMSRSTGITHEDFCLFVPTLIHADRLTEHVAAIREYHSARDKTQFILKWLQEFYHDSTLTTQSTKYKNLFDYGDNILRAFRQMVPDPGRKIDVGPIGHGITCVLK